ncbi:MAG TPA: TMEM175 family protein [Thermoanaerobaculia bacterium]|nr:TMEM175 family protein [Thermoanaerobaculia bacterium]
MLRDQIFGRLEHEGAALRAGGELARIEGLSDAVFAFAITLLVVSLEVPKTFDELLATMRGFFAFAIAFALLLYIWHRQYQFFRRYGLEDAWTLVLNGVLLFVVLVFVYPLKFLSSFMIDQITGYPLTVQLPGGALVPRVGPGQGAKILILYGLGYAAVFLVFSLLYSHAWRRRGALGLDPMQALRTRESIQESAIHTAVALASVGIAYFGGERLVTVAGFLYFALGPALTVHGTLMGRQRSLLEERLQSLGR